MEKLPKINIIYEDNHLLVVNKPANMPVCLDSSNDIDLLSKLKEYLKSKYNKPGNVYLGIVHRLDRPVGGIMVFAKTSKAAARLSKQIQDKKFSKIYYAIVQNKLKDKDTLTDYLIKDQKQNISYVTTKDKGKLAILDYEVIDTKNNLNLVKINLHTGRSHQIRVQFSTKGNPLLGDSKYGENKEKLNICLFAKELSFVHPTTKEQMTFNLPLPNKYPYNIFKKNIID